MNVKTNDLFQDGVFFLKQLKELMTHPKNCEIREEGKECNCGINKSLETLQFHYFKFCQVCRNEITTYISNVDNTGYPNSQNYFECKNCKLLWDASGQSIQWAPHRRLPPEFFAKR